jgi:hypothetical protein
MMRRLIAALGILVLSATASAADQWDITYRTAAGTGPPKAGKISELTAESTPASGDYALCEPSTGELRKCDIGAFPLPLIPNSAGASPTTLGVLEFDTTADRLVIGDGAATVEFPNSSELATLDGSASITGAWTFSNITIQAGAVTAHEGALTITESQISDLDHDAVKIRGVNVDGSLATPSDGDIMVYRSAGTDWMPEPKPASGSNPACSDITDGTTAGCALVTAANVAAQQTTLNVEDGADVTDTANVTSAGALMDSEVDADIKTLALPASTTISAFGATLTDDSDSATARATLALDSTSSPQFAGINVGNASDTTITRTAAGTIAVEGNVLYRKGGSNPLLGPVNISAKTAATYTVGTDDTYESYGTLFINSDNDAIDFTLPSAVAGMSACFTQGQGVSGAITVQPASGDYLVIDGVRGTVATNYNSTGAGEDRLCVIAQNATDWIVTSKSGTWSE